MSKRARFGTNNGDTLTISRGILSWKSADGKTTTHSVQGVDYNRERGILTVDFLSLTGRGFTKETFFIEKAPEDFRKESLSTFLEVELGRLMNALNSHPQTISVTTAAAIGEPTKDASEGRVTNRLHDKAVNDLKAFCKRYNLPFDKLMKGTKKSEVLDKR